MTTQRNYHRIEQFIRQAVEESDAHASKIVDQALTEVGTNVVLITPMLIAATRKEVERRQFIKKHGDPLRVPTLDELAAADDRPYFEIVELDDGSAWKYLEPQEAEHFAMAIGRHVIEHDGDDSQEILVNITTFEITRLFCVRCGIYIFGS